MDPGGAIITINALTGGHPPRPYNAVVQVNLFQKLITSGEHVVYQNCSECQNKTKTTICVHICGLVDEKIRASDKDLPVRH